jgi:RNA polymerase sigma-70 factor (ECF subfamily)
MAQGDRDAFTELYNKYWEELFVRVARLIPVRDDASDIVQDIFLSLWNRREELEINSSAGAYLHTSARYKTINYIEKNITRQHYIEMLASLGERGEEDNPATTLQRKELNEMLQGTIDKMPPKMKEVYLLSRQEQLSHREIAERLSISEETVKKHIQHALKLLKNAMGQSGRPGPGLSMATILVNIFF